LLHHPPEVARFTAVPPRRDARSMPSAGSWCCCRCFRGFCCCRRCLLPC